MSNPTELESAAESSTSSTIAGPTFAPSAFQGGINAYEDSNYDVFDPSSWTLDGMLDLPWNFGEGDGTLS